MVWREGSFGFPQEMAHFVDCVLNDRQPLVTGEDARVVMEIVLAAYESAGRGKRTGWPYQPPRDKAPQQVWEG
jgi:predicted dehydrogenase